MYNAGFVNSVSMSELTKKCHWSEQMIASPNSWLQEKSDLYDNIMLKWTYYWKLLAMIICYC